LTQSGYHQSDIEITRKALLGTASWLSFCK
jgi:hypothetical protein